MVADQKYLDIRETQPEDLLHGLVAGAEPRPIGATCCARRGAVAPSIAAITATVAAFDPTATMRYALLDTQVAEAMLQERLMARLSAIFGGVALLLAIVGLYGVVSYSVASRRAEIGVRVALGASRPRILR